ncbi:GCS-domain-containing protein [Gonapodya prolifera JEL478]|uniref:Glutamate--cysteine ligase n=1 Tax=Gonapodya prolifera (strain JEL478) TaxID=1344416 RepID=A0A139AMP0_GONPJ|nr:GCS-domain-containing protein [Gonapodya prolifera JEL478]|eukprot:KXS18037.1 GCS-domain-containing protein [Gonapodya prolifera JEL478]
MGLLTLGTPLSWDEAKQHAEHVRAHGIEQFLNIWNKCKTRRSDALLFGDEVEYLLAHFDYEGDDEETNTAKVNGNGVAHHRPTRVRLSTTAHELVAKLAHEEEVATQSGLVADGHWVPEYGRFMAEATPARPFGSTLNDLLEVEKSMKKRRRQAEEVCAPHEALLTLTVFPRLGCPDSFYPSGQLPAADTSASRSIFIPDSAINPHARFPTLTANIRTRRGEKVAINLPIFRDKNTPSPFLEPAPPSLLSSTTLPQVPVPADGKATIPGLLPDCAKPDHVYLDAMAFGMGNCCLQITFQACSVEEARRLYDALIPVAPILTALSAASPIFRGYLVDVDCRWNTISGSVDDRTREERGLEPLRTSTYRIPKSRYDSVSLYLSGGPNYSGGCGFPRLDMVTPRHSPEGTPQRPRSVAEMEDPCGCGDSTSSEKSVDMDYFDDKYNDIPVPINQKVYERLRENDIDHHLAQHISHLFIRDPLVVYKELLDQDDSQSSDHFENIQSTNWQTLRFKPPPPNNPNIGWRVEFRPLELQMTDFENAAFSVFVVLLVRAVLGFGLNFYMPLSKVDENLQTAQKRDAAKSGRFWFRRNICANQDLLEDLLPAPFHSLANGGGVPPPGYITHPNNTDPDQHTLMTINDIMNGNTTLGFPGLIPIVRAYLQGQPHVDRSVRDSLERYVDFIAAKSRGDLVTTASFLRKVATEHPDYKGDSVISEQIAADLCNLVRKIGEGDPEVLEMAKNCCGV